MNVAKGQYHFEHTQFKRCSYEVKDLIARLLIKDPKKRFTADQAYNHPWIQRELSKVKGQEITLEIAGIKDYLDCQNLKRQTLTLIAS